jgi:DNA-binding LacI/PurR family transcriptional regulator
MDQRKITMRDVAREAGVSQMTVSAVLGGKSAQSRISEPTQVRVIETAREMGYQPNAIARSLRRRSTNVIGFYSGYGYLDAHNTFYAELISGLQAGGEQHRKDLLLHGVYRGGSVDDIYAELMDGRVDGLVLNAGPQDPLADRLAASHLPVVALVDAIATVPSVVVADAEGSAFLAAHLAGKGHRRLLYRYSNHKSLVSATRRREAFLHRAAEYGMEVRLWEDDITRPADIAELDWFREAPGLRPTAVVCWNDLVAYELLAQCHKYGLRTPDDLAVVGFDGVPTPFDFVRRLTTVRAPWAEVARTAVDLLIAQIQGEPVCQETILPVELICGDTG